MPGTIEDFCKMSHLNIPYALKVPEAVKVWMVYPPALVTVPPVPRCEPR